MNGDMRIGVLTWIWTSSLEPGFHGRGGSAWPRFAAALTCCAALGGSGNSQDPPVPLWQWNPFDRVTLTNGVQHDIDPERIPEGTEFFVEEGKYVGRAGLPTRREIQRLLLYKIRLQGNGREFFVQGRHIQTIERYEDLLLAEAHRLIDAFRFEEAYPYLQRVAEIAPDWPGLIEAMVEYHREEGIRSDILGRPDRAFWSLIEAQRVCEAVAEPGRLPESIRADIDRVADKWAADRLRAQDFSEARRIVARLESMRPDNAVAAKYRAEIARTVQALLEEARTLLSQGSPLDALDRLEAAARRDPTNTNVTSALDDVYRSHGHVRVAVEQLPYLRGPLPQSRADRRVFPLIHVSLEEPVLGSDPPSWTSSVLAGLEQPDPSNPRQTVLRLRTGLHWPDGKPVTLVDLERVLVQTCRPGAPTYNPAFARLASDLRPEPPDRLILDFSSPQPRPQAWLDVPFTRARSTNLGKEWLGLGPFVVHAKDREHVEFRAATTGNGQKASRIAKIREVSVRQAAERLAALEENRVDLVTDLLPRQAHVATRIKGVRVVELTTPVVHVVQFNWNQRALRDRTLRRAFAYAIDRKAILERLGSSVDEAALPTAPWPVGSFGYDASISPRPYDPILARTLVSAVKRKMSSLPTLRLLHGGSESDTLVCERIADGLKAAGVDVTVEAFNPDSPSSLATSDMVYTSLRVTEPVQDTVTVLTRDNPSLWDYASPWLRQAVVDLNREIRVSETARLLPRLHRILHDDVTILPIWQERPLIAVSERVTGLPANSTAVYDGILQWSIRPGLERAYWTPATQNTVGGAD